MSSTPVPPNVCMMQITATIRTCAPAGGPTPIETRTFEALASGISEVVDAAVTEGIGVYRVALLEALEAVGISVALVNAGQVKQLKGRKTDVVDDVWLPPGVIFHSPLGSHVEHDHSDARRPERARPRMPP